MLSDIAKALEGTGKPVYYGRAGKLDGPDLWDYIVFWRGSMSPTGNKRAYADTYLVTIVQEEFIEDGVAETVIDAMTALPGVRLANGNHPYTYTVKPKTETVIEMLSLEFVRPRLAR